MPKQPAFPALRAAMKKKLMRRKLFLAQSEVPAPLVRVNGGVRIGHWAAQK